MSSAPTPNPDPGNLPGTATAPGSDTVRPTDRLSRARPGALPGALSGGRPGGWCDRVCDALPGWVFCGCGAVLLAMVVLTPVWLTHDETAWRLRVMQAQATALQQQTERYQAFAAAIGDDDPVVLERLALTHLRMTVKGKTPLWVRPVEQDTGDIGAWLAVPQPVLGRDVPHYVPPSNRMTRLVTGPGRPALLAVGLMCLVAGVLFNPRSGRASVRGRWAGTDHRSKPAARRTPPHRVAEALPPRRRLAGVGPS